MDEMDKQLLAHLEENSRLSLKKLAQKIDVKTSTLYHRLHKLSESKIIERNSVIINPQSIGVKHFYLLVLSPKSLGDTLNSPDKMFLTSFATFLTEQFKEIYFGAVGDDSKLYILVTFFSDEHRNRLFEILKNNPYIGEIEANRLPSISKGLRMFCFNEEELLNEINKKKNKKKKKKK